MVTVAIENARSPGQEDKGLGFKTAIQAKLWITYYMTLTNNTAERVVKSLQGRIFYFFFKTKPVMMCNTTLFAQALRLCSLSSDIFHFVC